MSRHLLAGGLLALALASSVSVDAKPAHRAAASAFAPAATPEDVGFDSARLKRLDDYMAGVVADGRVPGMTTLLLRHGRVVDFKAYGARSVGSTQPMTKDTLFRIYSMTKPVTGVAMMILFEEGKWRLDDPVTRYIPEFKSLKVMVKADADGKITQVEDLKRPPTMREIMSHTAGFGYGLGDDHPVDKLYRERKVLAASSMQEMIDRTATIPLMFQPGSDWSYSSAVDIQGAIVERLSGMSLAEFMDRRIFKPLKMNDTGFYAPKDKAGRLAGLYVWNKDQNRLEEAKQLFGFDLPTYLEPPPWDSGGAGLVSSTMDYARFCQMLLNGGALEGVRILSPASVEMMDTNMIPRHLLRRAEGVAGQFNETRGFGLDFALDTEPRAEGLLVGKNTMSWGGAAGTWFWIDPTNDVVFVGMIQRFGGTGGDDLGTQARTLTYQALVHPER